MAVAQAKDGAQINIQEIIEKVNSSTIKECESNLLIATDEDCFLHAPLSTLSKAARALQYQEQPENEERLRVLVGTPPSGILMTDDNIENDLWLNKCEQATIADILRVHEYSFIKFLKQSCDSVPNKSFNES